MIRILYVDRHATDVRRHSRVIIDHCHGSFLSAELQKRLKTKMISVKRQDELNELKTVSRTRNSKSLSRTNSDKSEIENISAGHAPGFCLSA